MKTEQPKSKIKTGGYSSVKLHAKRDAKRRDAAARNAVWSALSIDEKLGIISTRRGASNREVFRLTIRKHNEKANVRPQNKKHS